MGQKKAAAFIIGFAFGYRGWGWTMHFLYWTLIVAILLHRG